MNQFEARLMVLSQKVDSKVTSYQGGYELKYLDEKKVKWLQSLRRFPFGRVPMYQQSKSEFLLGDLINGY